MKKVLIFGAVTLILISLVFALDNSSNLNDTNNNENHTIVTNNTQTNNTVVANNTREEDNEDENHTIVNNTDREDDENENQRRYMRDIRKEIKNEWRNMTSDEKKDFIKEIKDERNELRTRNGTCPLNCTCTGSTIKCYLDDGTRIMTIYAGKSGNIIIQIDGENMTTNVTLYHHDGKIFGVFKNKTGNDTREIFVSPDKVKEKIKERLRTRACENNTNCTINLDDDGVYKVDMEKKARLFAIFPIKERVKIHVDSETGNVTIIKPWWRFLAREINED